MNFQKADKTDHLRDQELFTTTKPQKPVKLTIDNSQVSEWNEHEACESFQYLHSASGTICGGSCQPGCTGSRKTLVSPKELNAVGKNVLLLFFSSSLPIFPSIFSQTRGPGFFSFGRGMRTKVFSFLCWVSGVCECFLFYFL